MEHLKLKFTLSFYIYIALSIVFKHGYYCAMYFLAVFLHELAHYVVARKLFYKCNNITLSAFGAVLYGEFEGVEKSNSVLIALAGPFANLVLCVLCLALWWCFPSLYAFTDVFFEANCSLLFTNLLPCYPLDGGRVFAGILENKFTRKKSFALTCKLTVVFAVISALVFVTALFFNVWLISVLSFAVCLAVSLLPKSNSSCYTKFGYCAVYTQRLVMGMEKKTLVFGTNSTMADVVKRMQDGYLYSLEVVDENFNLLMHFSVRDVDRLVLGYPPQNKLKDAKQFLQNKS